MSYEEYQDIIASIDGKHVDKEARAKAREEAGITTRNYNFNETDDEGNNQWSGTLYLLNDEPIQINFYIWSVDFARIVREVSKDLGYEVEFYDGGGGNGHYSNKVKRK